MCTLFLSSSYYILDIKGDLSSSTKPEYHPLEEQNSDIGFEQSKVPSSIRRWRCTCRKPLTARAIHAFSSINVE